MSTYQSLLNAIAYAELAGKTFKEVSYKQEDIISANSQQIPTMAKRITDQLEALIPELKGDDGVSIQDVYKNERSIYIEYSDGKVDAFVNILPEDAVSIQDYTVNGDGFLVETSSTGDNVVGDIMPDEPKGITDFEVLSNGDIRISYNIGSTEDVGNIESFGEPAITNSTIVNDELTITLVNGTEIDLGNVKGERGEDGSIFSKIEQVRTGDETVYFDFYTEDGDTFRVGPALVERKLAEPEDVLRHDYDETTGELLLYPAGVPVIDLGSMHGIDGDDADDGITVDSISMNNDGTEVSAVLSDNRTINFVGKPKEVIVPAGETEVLSYGITANRELVFEIGLPDGSNPVKVNVGRVRGDDGITIDDIKILSNGDIEVTVNDDGTITTNVIGNIAYEFVETAEILPTRELVFHTNKGNTITATGSPDGDDGDAGTFIQSVDYDTENEGMVSVTLTDSTTINDLGKARPLQTHTVERNIDDEIVFTYADGTTDNIGVIDGVDARNVSDVTLNTDGTLTVTFDDTTSISTTNTINKPLSGISLIETTDPVTDETTHELSFSYTDYDKVLSYDKPDDGEHGLWLTQLEELNNGRVRAHFSDGTNRILAGGSIHGKWPVDIEFKKPEPPTPTDPAYSYSDNDLDIFWTWNDTNIGDNGVENIATITKFYANDGDAIIDANYETNGDLVFNWNKESIADTVIEKLSPVWAEDVYLEGDTFYAVYNHLDDPQEIVTIDGFNGRDGVWVTNMRINGLTDELVIEYSDDSTQNMGVIDGVEGNWFTDITRDENGHLITTNRFGNDVDQGDFSHLDGLPPRWITDARINSDRKIEVLFNNESDYTIIGDADGADAKIPETFLINPSRDFKLTYVDSTLDTLGSADGTDGVILEDIDVDATTREMFIYYSDRTDNLGNIDGTDGRVLIDLYRNTNGELEAQYYDEANPETYGNIDGTDGRVLIDLYRNTNGELEAQYYDEANPETYSKIDGEDFTTEIVNISETDGKMVVESTDGSTVNTDVIVRRIQDAVVVDDVLSLETNYTVNPIEVGNNAGADVDDGIYITNLEVENQQLMATYSDTAGTRVSIGAFNRADFDTAELINGLDANQENLQITLTDSSTFDLGRVKGQGETVNIVDGLINIDGNLVLTYSNDTTYTSTSRIQGEHGIDISTSTINTEGILVFNMSDSTTIEAGFVLQDLGFAPFDFTRTYDRGESATNNGNIYVALNDGVTSEPTPDNSEWARVRLEGDGNSPDASRPEIISPKNDEVHEFKQPYLLGGELRNYYSVDTRNRRIFQIDLAGNNFINPIYEAEENLDGHQVELDLVVGTEYKWRCRDVVEQTGYITDWSLDGYFTVSENIVERPIANLTTSMDINSVPALPMFESSAFSGTGTHTASTWEIKRNSDDNMVYEYTGNDLLSTVIPFGILFESEDYSVRVQHHSTDGNSPYSSWLPFTTAVKFDFELKPVIEYVGDNVNSTTAKPYFKATSFVDEFYDYFMDSDNLNVVWEVKDNTGTVVWSTDNQYDILSVQVGEPVESGVEHTIRVKYYSDRFFGDSEWSDPVSFTPDWFIATPTVTTPYDVTEYPVDGLFESTAFDARNEEHYGSLWEIRLATDDSVQHTTNKSFRELLEWNVSFGERDSQQEYYIVLKHLGRYGESEWSAPLNFTMQEIIEVSIYITSEDNSVRRLYGDGGIAWLNEDHTSTTNDVDVDDLRFAYSVGNDNVLRQVNEFGVEQWTYTHTTSITSVGVDDLYNVIIGTVDNLVIKLDNTGTEVWRYEGHTGTINSIAIGSERNVYTASADNTAKSIDEDGNEVWSFSGHSNSVNGIDVDRNGNAYTASSDNTVRKISPRGLQEWSFTGHTNNVNDVAVNTNFNVYTASSDTTVKMIDSTGTEVWSYDFTVVATSVDTDYLNRCYVGGNDFSVRMISDSGTLSWEYTQNTGNITSVTTNEIPVLMKPIEVSGRYWNLVAPENLVAF